MGDSAALVAVAEGLVPVSYSMVSILRDTADLDDPDLPSPEAEVPDDDQMLAGEDWIAFASTTSNHQAAVRIEHWASEPATLPVDSGDGWELTWDATLTMSAPGTLRAWEMTGGPANWFLDLPAAGPYAVRAYSGGRAAVAQATMADDGRR